MQEQCDYFVACPEVGASGTPHIQFYLAFKKPTTFVTVSKALKKEAWLFIKRGSCKQASDYCKKGEMEWKVGVDNSLDELFGLNLSPDIIEYGLLPQEQEVAGGKATEEIWQNNIVLAQEGRFEEMTPSHQVLHWNKYVALRERTRPKPKRLTWQRGQSPNLWIWGPTGTGKTYYSESLFTEFYNKMKNKWWDGFDEDLHEAALIQDIGQSHASWIGDFLKEWADIYPFTAEFKNGTFTKGIRPKVIIVTSNYTPQELFPDPNVHLPIMDRFQMMEMKDKYNPQGVIVPDTPVRNYPMFDVVRDLFAVQTADAIPRGPNMLSDSDADEDPISQVMSEEDPIEEI